MKAAAARAELGDQLLAGCASRSSRPSAAGARALAASAPASRSTSTPRSTRRSAAVARARSSRASRARSPAAASTPTYSRASPTRASPSTTSSPRSAAASTARRATRASTSRRRRSTPSRAGRRHDRAPAAAARGRARAHDRRRAAHRRRARADREAEGHDRGAGGEVPGRHHRRPASFRLRLWKELKLAKTYPIAVGAAGLETPAGLYTIKDKQVDPSGTCRTASGRATSPARPSRPARGPDQGALDGHLRRRRHPRHRRLGGSLGTAASHGCIRMAIPDVIDLYDRTPVGAPVYIA